MKASKLLLNGNPNIGSLVFVNNKFGIISPKLYQKYKEELEETFNIKFYQTTISGTDLVGIFLAGNDKLIVAPNIIFKDELKVLEDISKEHNVTLIISNNKNTALGNLMLFNNKGLIISKELNDKQLIKKITEVDKELKVEILDKEILIGSLSTVNNRKGIVSPLIYSQINETITKHLGIETIEMTTNFGNNFVSAGIALNDFGYIISDLSSPVETYEIDQFLNE